MALVEQGIPMKLAVVGCAATLARGGWGITGMRDGGLAVNGDERVRRRS